MVGGIGTLADSDVLRQGGGYLGAAGQLGSGAQTIADVFGGGVSNLTDAARLASGLGQVGGAVGRVTGNRPLQQVSGLLGMGARLGGGVQGLLGAAGQAQQRGVQPQAAPVPRTMNDTDWLGQNWRPGPWQQNRNRCSGTFEGKTYGRVVGVDRGARAVGIECRAGHVGWRLTDV